MDDSSVLKKRNQVKAIASFCAFLAAVFVGNPNDLIIDGPGIISGLCLIVVVISIIYLFAKAE